MGERTFRELEAEMFRLYGAQEYSQAWALVEREAPRFPDQAWRTTFWRMCLAARSDDTPAALRAFEEGVSAGHWWSENGLRQDPDLKPLQGRPEFERLVSVCLERQAAAQAQTRPELLVLRPVVPPPYPVIVALHGAGGTAESFAPHWQPAISAGWLVARAQSSRVAGPHGYGWWDLERAEREISAHFQTLRDEHPIRADQIVLAGFSQGGSTAIWLALRQTVPATGFLGIACATRDLEETRVHATRLQAKIRGYLLVGDADYVFERTRALHDLLQSAGVPTELEIRPGLGHAIPDDFEVSLRRALAHITQSPP